MKIAIGKIGRSIQFNSNSWGAIGGDNEAPVFYENLFNRNPNIDFYLIGVTDYSRLSEQDKARINKHGNVYDPWEKFKEWNKTYTGHERGDRITYMQQVIMPSLPKLDAGLFFAGPVATSNVFGKTPKVLEPDKLANPLMMQAKYAGPIVDYLNESNIKWAMILNDPRYYPSQINDLFNVPKIILSQYNDTLKAKRFTSYKDVTRIYIPIEAKYSKVETIFLIGKDRINPEKENKDIKFMVVCNEGRPSRYGELKKYILDHIDDVEIYGKWDKNILQSDKRFKGPRKFIELQKMLPNVKYTFCIPIKKGWVTSKFWEMAHYGIIPFLHPDYDTQNNLNVHNFFRVKNEKDLYDKIELLETNPEIYNTVRSLLNSMIKDEYYTGEEMNDLAIKTLSQLVN